MSIPIILFLLRIFHLHTFNICGGEKK